MSIGVPRDVIDMRVELGGVLELGEVFEFLIGVAMARHRRRPAGQRDHRGAGEIRIFEAGREIGGADVLCHADSRFP